MRETVLGLRIDVDTFRGTRIGVPNLQKVLSSNQISASFFFCVGPDNMGRHIYRLLKPAFLKKMLRSDAPNLYGWGILLKGTFWPGPVIGEKCADIIRAAASDGHEIGIHAWDHYQWQAHIHQMGWEEIVQALKKGVESLAAITGERPACSASPGWLCNDTVLEVKDGFQFLYNSDARGTHPFFPIVRERVLTRPQIPVTLPTYDEIIGRHGLGPGTYNDYLLSLMVPGQPNVLTIHAEVEGILCLELFKDFIKKARDKHIRICPLGRLLENAPVIDTGIITHREIPGREGNVAVQAENRDKAA